MSEVRPTRFVHMSREEYELKRRNTLGGSSEELKLLDIVELEPSFIPHCKTCRWFLLCTHPAGEAICTLTTTRKKADGSGYCDQHTEARR